MTVRGQLGNRQRSIREQLAVSQGTVKGQLEDNQRLDREHLQITQGTVKRQLKQLKVSQGTVQGLLGNSYGRVCNIINVRVQLEDSLIE